jgi:hypothetical protein
VRARGSISEQDGFVRVRWLVDGRRLSRCFSTRTEAEAFADQLPPRGAPVPKLLQRSRPSLGPAPASLPAELDGRFPFRELERLLDVTDDGRLAERLGRSRRWLATLRSRPLTVWEADRLAVAAGFHPVEVWGDAWLTAGTARLAEAS